MKQVDEIPEGYKKCSKCGEVKAIGEFARSKDRKDGHIARCKKCISEWYKKYYEENREYIAERQKKCQQENKEKKAEYDKKYYRKNKKKAMEWGKKYREENRDVLAVLHCRTFQAINITLIDIQQDQKIHFLSQLYILNLYIKRYFKGEIDMAKLTEKAEEVKKEKINNAEWSAVRKMLVDGIEQFSDGKIGREDLKELNATVRTYTVMRFAERKEQIREKKGHKLEDHRMKVVS